MTIKINFINMIIMITTIIMNIKIIKINFIFLNMFVNKLFLQNNSNKVFGRVGKLDNKLLLQSKQVRFLKYTIPVKSLIESPFGYSD